MIGLVFGDTIKANDILYSLSDYWDTDMMSNFGKYQSAVL